MKRFVLFVALPVVYGLDAGNHRESQGQDRDESKAGLLPEAQEP